jgi:hypothetical protein
MSSVKLNKSFINSKMFELDVLELRMYLWLKFWVQFPKYRMTIRDTLSSNKHKRGMVLSDREVCHHLHIFTDTGDFDVRTMRATRQALEAKGLLMFDGVRSLALNDDPRGIYRVR